MHCTEELKRLACKDILLQFSDICAAFTHAEAV